MSITIVKLVGGGTVHVDELGQVKLHSLPRKVFDTLPGKVRDFNQPTWPGVYWCKGGTALGYNFIAFTDEPPIE